MIIDTSAIIAILRDESEAMSCARAIESAASRKVSAVNFVEAAIVIDMNRDPIASRRFDELCREAQLTIEPVTETQARIATLQKQLQDMAGSSGSLTPVASGPNGALASPDFDKGELYPQLRQIPRLAVPFADLYRRVKVQEAVFELLTQQYELARIEEAKDVPVVSVIDSPGIPEKKSFPPRVLLALLLTFLTFAGVSALILMRDHWSAVDPCDPRKMLVAEVLPVIRRRARSILRLKRGAA